MTRDVRPAACAGRFYAGDAATLRSDIEGYLEAAGGSERASAPKALIAPHAGYMYSGPIAATGYRRLQDARERITRVVLLGPAHFAALDGLAASSARAFATPLGLVEVDLEARDAALRLPQVRIDDRAHAREHSLEVQLPFLQVVLDAFRVVPLTVGDASDAEVAEVLELLWGREETLVVVSSDLSHYEDDETATRMDAETAEAIESLEVGRIWPVRACGYAGIRGLLAVARRRGLEAHTLDLRTSAATSGQPERVVGYGAFTVG